MLNNKIMLRLAGLSLSLFALGTQGFSNPACLPWWTNLMVALGTSFLWFGGSANRRNNEAKPVGSPPTKQFDGERSYCSNATNLAIGQRSFCQLERMDNQSSRFKAATAEINASNRTSILS